MDKNPSHLNNPVIGFRIQKDLKSIIFKLAENRNMSVQKLIKDIVIDYLTKENIVKNKYEINI